MATNRTSSLQAQHCSQNANSNGGHTCGGPLRFSDYTWNGTLYNWHFGPGNAAGQHRFLIGGPVMSMVTSPARNGKVTLIEKFGTEPVKNSTGAL